MLILLAGDWHGNIDQATWCLDLAVRRHVGRVFQVGDFGAWEHKAHGVEYLDQLEKRAAERNVLVYWLDGNHDKWSLVMEKYADNRDDEGFVICRPHVRYAPRTHTWTWDTVRFMALGGAYSVDKAPRLEWEQTERRNRLDKTNRYGAEYVDPAGMYWFPEEELTNADVMAAMIQRMPDVAVLLTHDKPRRSNPQWNRKDFPECLPNQDRIQSVVDSLRPGLLVHGHLHYRYSDFLEYPNGHGVHVVGLDADPDAAMFPGYTRYNNVILLALDASDGRAIVREISPP